MNCKKCGGSIENRRRLCDACRRVIQQKSTHMKAERRGDKIRCRICGRRFVLLAVHTYWTHGLTGREYRKKFGYDVKRGLVPEHYRLARVAQNARTGANLRIVGTGATPFEKGHANDYERSTETLGVLATRLQVEATRGRQSEAMTEYWRRRKERKRREERGREETTREEGREETTREETTREEMTREEMTKEETTRERETRTDQKEAES